MAVSLNEYAVGSQEFRLTTPTTYSPTISNTDTVSSSVFKYWREGKYLAIDGILNYNNAGAAGAVTISLPTGLVIDTSYLSSGTNTASATATLLGHGQWFDAGVGWKACWPRYASTTTFNIATVNQAWSNDIAGNGDSIQIRVYVPIVSW